ncbi:MAG: preprotein translocase subunit YajC [Saprospiraceae bacterium]|nr:preprotein translocase subunit YajC [Saprospiraceae bacterium]MDW8484716.1 preprotein translocase subunit YajC [Saprospiraceae bacterium]
MMLFILLQASQGGGNPWIGFLFPVLIIFVFWFFLVRPQVKRQREQQKFIENLREGMEVVTSAGIIGKVTKIDGNVVRLLIDERTFIRVLKQTITGEFKPGS